MQPLSKIGWDIKLYLRVPAGFLIDLYLYECSVGKFGKSYEDIIYEDQERVRGILGSTYEM